MHKVLTEVVASSSTRSSGYFSVNSGSLGALSLMEKVEEMPTRKTQLARPAHGVFGFLQRASSSNQDCISSAIISGVHYRTLTASSCVLEIQLTNGCHDATSRSYWRAYSGWRLSRSE